MFCADLALHRDADEIDDLPLDPRFLLQFPKGRRFNAFACFSKAGWPVGVDGKFRIRASAWLPATTNPLRKMG